MFVYFKFLQIKLVAAHPYKLAQLSNALVNKSNVKTQTVSKQKQKYWQNDFSGKIVSFVCQL